MLLNTWGSTFTSQLKAAWASVTPHSSFFSPSMFGVGRYLYSFFNTGSEKNGFSPKYCNATREAPDCNRKVIQATYELQSKTPLFLGISIQPDILKVVQSNLVLMVHGVYRDSRVVQQGIRPELGNALQNLASLPEERSIVLL
jgi:hypothetical protein